MATFLSNRVTVCLLGLVMVALLAAIGCTNQGVQKLTVRGTVSYQGQPLQSGFLKFVGKDGAYSAANIQKDGKFTITDVVPGEVKVAVAEAPGGSKQGAGNPKGPSLPDKYRDPATSGLQYTITPETTELTIDIK
jgi:hypothetical protein